MTGQGGVIGNRRIPPFFSLSVHPFPRLRSQPDTTGGTKSASVTGSGVIKLIIIHLVGTLHYAGDPCAVETSSFIETSTDDDERSDVLVCGSRRRPIKVECAIPRVFRPRRATRGSTEDGAKRALFAAFKMKPCPPDAHLGHRSAVFAAGRRLRRRC